MSDEVKCSFCGKGKEQAKKMIQSAVNKDAAICLDCAMILKTQLHEEEDTVA